MQQQEEKDVDIYFIVRPIYYFSRLCGLWIHSLKVYIILLLKFNNNWHSLCFSAQRSTPAIGTTSLLYYCFLFSIYIYCFYINLDKDFWYNKFGPVAGSEIQTFGNFFAKSLYHLKSFERVLKQFFYLTSRNMDANIVRTDDW